MCAIVSQERDDRETMAMVTIVWQWCGNGDNGDNGVPLSLCVALSLMCAIMSLCADISLSAIVFNVSTMAPFATMAHSRDNVISLSAIVFNVCHCL